MRAFVLAAAAFAAMEPATAATHRFVMHGFGMGLHRSHHVSSHHVSSHRRRMARFEANDAYPVLFAAIVCIALWLGFNQPALADLVPIGVGVTAYGAAYALVHDVYIHHRLRWFGDRRVPVLDRLAADHTLHHRFNGAPYGMLVPIVPSRVRQRVAAVPRP